jgi:hypothetical protein
MCQITDTWHSIQTGLPSASLWGTVVRTTLKMSAVSQWCPSVRNESCLFLSSDFSTSFSSETYLSRPCFSAVFALFCDLRLPLSPAGRLLCPVALKPARHCPPSIQILLAHSLCPGDRRPEYTPYKTSCHRQWLKPAFRDIFNYFKLTQRCHYVARFLAWLCSAPATQLPTSPPPCDNYLFEAPPPPCRKALADAPDLRAG